MNAVTSPVRRPRAAGLLAADPLPAAAGCGHGPEATRRAQFR